MNIQKHPEHYGWFSESMDQTVTGLPVYICSHISAEFIDQDIPLLSVKLNIYGDERQGDEFVFVTIEENPIDLSGKLSPFIFEKVINFINVNKQILINYWNSFGEKETVRKILMDSSC
jgi:hypothetical protein